MWVGVSMTKYCVVCNHPDRKEVDSCLLDGGAGNSIKDIQERFNIKTTHLLKHKEQHMIESAKELVKMCNEEYDKMLKKKGVEKKLLSIEVLDAFIEKYKDVLGEVTAKDVLAAIKLKEELLGNVTQKREIQLTWLDAIPELEKEEIKDE